MKILIADDILENLYLLRTLLTSQGHKIVEAENGLEALDRARDSVPGPAAGPRHQITINTSIEPNNMGRSEREPVKLAAGQWRMRDEMV